MPTISARIDRETKAKINDLPEINWSQVIRDAIIHKVEEEMRKRTSKNWQQIRAASTRIDSLSRICEGNTTEELRRWRDQRK